MPRAETSALNRINARWAASAFAMLLALLALAPRAWSYPDLIRHNYVNCTACHVAPTGTGALNAYGRSMSKELLSAWGTERETAPFNGVVPPESFPEWLIVGGDVRYIQTHRESPDRKQGKWFLMQAALELGARIGQATGLISIGEVNPRTEDFRMVSTKYFLMWNPVDELALRAGRFTPIFGVPVAYHTVPTRQSLGFGPGAERDALEAVWSGEKWNAGFSTSRTPVGPVPFDQRETLVTGQINRNFLGSHRVGASYLKGFSNQSEREGVGVHGLFGFTEHLAYVTEFAHQRTLPRGAAQQNGLFHFSQLIYEVSKGWNVYLLEEYQMSNLSDSSTLVNSIGPGVRFFPRPHFEIDAVFLKRRTASVADRYDDYAWILLHYYF